MEKQTTFLNLCKLIITATQNNTLNFLFPLLDVLNSSLKAAPEIIKALKQKPFKGHKTSIVSFCNIKKLNTMLIKQQNTQRVHEHYNWMGWSLTSEPCRSD